MSNRHGWTTLVALVAFVALLLAACGPEMATPTAGVPAPTDTGAAAAETAPATSQAEPVGETPYDDLPKDPDDWRALGEPDAPVTITEYSDFQ